MKRRLLAVAAAAVLLPSALAPCAAHAALNLGDVTPDFHKTDLNGNPQTLFQYRGKVVVLFLLGSY
jgi:hypothetical protein